MTKTSPAVGSIGLGVIGLGFMGQTHLRACRSARHDGLPLRLAAVCDRDSRRLTGVFESGGNLGATTQIERLFDPEKVAVHDEPESLLADPRVDLVCVCTPTDTHVALAIRALEAGKHVLVEKPVAVEPAEIRRLIDAARESGRRCMPAMCMRFWPAWTWLRDRVRDESLGRLIGVTFQRLGSVPTWAAFYRDPGVSGGALVDLHIHDADFILWMLGAPASVSSTGTRDQLTTIYRYARGPAHVVAQGGWGQSAKFGFRMRYLANFENGTADFDLGRSPELLLSTPAEIRAIELPALSAYDVQLRHMLEAIASEGAPLRATLEDAEAVARLLQAEGRSLELGREVPFA